MFVLGGPPDEFGWKILIPVGTGAALWFLAFELPEILKGRRHEKAELVAAARRAAAIEDRRFFYLHTGGHRQH